jgi:4-hydroxyphenylpyruvate dioxygenase
LLSLDRVEFAVESIESYRPFLEGQLALQPVAVSTEESVAQSGQRSRMYAIGCDRLVLIEPVTSASRAGRFLGVHPAGVMTISLAVADAAECFDELLRRHATPVIDLVVRGGESAFRIASPLGDVEFRFVQRDRQTTPEGFEPLPVAQNTTCLPWLRIDHITANVRTAWPVAEWYRQVLGLEDLFFGKMHTGDGDRGLGTGFSWMILWDPESQLKLATNEPLRPNFVVSQTDRFTLENRGPGIQHIALAVPRIAEAVKQLVERGVPFLSAPASYYDVDLLRARARAAGWDFDKVGEPIELLRELNILVDGSSDGHMLQIFQPELSQLVAQDAPSPFFFELIQRAGDEGFGYGTFRALFESLEQQQREGRS